MDCADAVDAPSSRGCRPGELLCPARGTYHPPRMESCAATHAAPDQELVAPRTLPKLIAERSGDHRVRINTAFEDVTPPWPCTSAISALLTCRPRATRRSCSTASRRRYRPCAD